MSSRWIVTAVLTATCMALGPTLPASATTPGKDGHVAFVYRNSIWVVGPGTPGTEPSALPGTDFGRHPEWSPDGQSLAFVQGGAIKILDYESGDVRSIPGLSDATSAAWSPDGQALIVARSVDGAPSSVWTVGVDGQELTQLAHPGKCSASGFLFPAWSPDGSRFAYANTTKELDACRKRPPGLTVRQFGGPARVHLVSALRGGDTSDLTIGEFDFSSDGQSIVGSLGGRYLLTTSFVLRWEAASLVDSEEFPCVDGDHCLGGYQPTPSGTTAGIYYNDTQEGGSLTACLWSATFSECYSDPDFDVDGDETGFPWFLAHDIDIQPIP